MQNFRPFPPCVLWEMPGNPKIVPKLEKSTDHGHKLISSKDGQDTSACKISGQSLHAFSIKCPETSPDGRTDRRTDGHAVKRLWLVGWTNGPIYRSKEGISGFGRMDGRTDGQPENIMPPAPKGGGIQKSSLTIGSRGVDYWRLVPWEIGVIVGVILKAFKR